MTFDMVLRNAFVVDGTGSPGAVTDVAVRGKKIAAVGRIPKSECPELDLSGLVLAPGFIDIHTHYDAQIFWDPALTPSSWYGVTTVIMGNCGFGIAPMTPGQRRDMLRTLENVEDMPLASLEVGVAWSFETFAEYLAAIERMNPVLNVGVYVGHTPLRYTVMGTEAADREASTGEIELMSEIVYEAMCAGAMGFATSVAAGHIGADGKPVPSRRARHEERVELCRAVGRSGVGCLMVAGWEERDEWFSELYGLSHESGRPLTWSALLADTPPWGFASARQLLARHASWDAGVRPQIACRPVVMQVSLSNPLPLSGSPAFRELWATPHEGRVKLCSDPDWRRQAIPDMVKVWGGRWDDIYVSESKVHGEAVNRSLAELADDRGDNPAHTMLDLAVAESLETRFTIVVANGDEEELAELLQDARPLIGLSDAGAHVSQLCDASFAPYMLEHWVRKKKVLSLETAVWRITGEPAEYFGISDRGRIEEGCYADLVAFDRELVGVEPARRVYDFPAGADRLVSDPTGIEHVWVNGVQIRSHGRQLQLINGPGDVIRPSAG